jgi:acetyl-CoA acetyltransferase family protein
MPLTAYIVDAVRTPVGKRNGTLSQNHPSDLGATVIDALLDRTKIKGELVDDVIFGCVSQVGSQAGNVARNCVLSSRLPISVPGTSVDRQCGSSQQAFHFAAQAVMSGTQDIVIAGGVEVMSQCPIGSSVQDGMMAGHGQPWGGNEIQAKYGEGIMFSQFEGAEMVAKKFGVSREEMDDFAYASHKKAHEATVSGRFQRELVSVKGKSKDGNDVVMEKDEGIRWPANREKLGKLKLLGEGGRITAATSSQISDGASAILVCNEEGLKKLGLKPRAKVVALALAGDDPVMMLHVPIPATQKVLQKSGLGIDQIDLYEVNEAFASVPLAWQKQIGADLNKLNVNGGAMALGHPLGATGTKLLTTLLNELERRGGKYGLQAICEGGGTANACIIELCSSPAKL